MPKIISYEKSEKNECCPLLFIASKLWSKHLNFDTSRMCLHNASLSPLSVSGLIIKNVSYLFYEILSLY